MDSCSIDGCERPKRTKGMCQYHYKRLWKYGDPETPSLHMSRFGGCSVPTCLKEIQARGLCAMHYARLRKNGDVGTAAKRGAEGWITPKGYRYFKIDGHSIAEQRYVMQNHIGRPLLPEETVHHINGDRLDNRIENLELWSSNHPSGQRVSDKVDWAKRMLALYEPGALRGSDA